MTGLLWPDGWPRTPAHKRQRGAFHYWGLTNSWTPPGEAQRTTKVKRPLTRAMALRRVTDEVGMMGGTGLRIDTGEDMRLDGQPRSNQPRDLDPGVVVSFRLRGNKPIVFPCDRYDSVEQNLGAIAATLEAKRAIERHGVTTLDREFEGYKALPASAGSVIALPPLHETLQVAPTAPPDVWKAAWKAWLLKNHPDRGGNADRFTSVKAQYEAMMAEPAGVA